MEKQGGEESNSNPNNNAALINSFCEITSSTKEEALFFLESHNWDLDLAVSTFLDDSASAPATVAAASIVPPNLNRSPSPSLSASVSPVSSPEYAPSLSPQSRSRTPSPTPSRARYQLRSRQKTTARKKNQKPHNPGSRTRGGIRTLADLNQTPPDGRNDDDDDEDYEPQEYYAGGEKSGMLVQDPTKSGDVDEIFTQASRSAVERPSDHTSSSSRSFTGTARLLSGETLPSAPQQPEAITHTITFWRNGFTVDDGPLRRMDDPANASFLESIKKSECPRELAPANGITPVHVNLVRREENYRELERRQTPFQGVGRTLGSSNSDDTAASDPTVASTILTTAPSPAMGLVVDTLAPTTSIQLRLADGTRMVSRFNFYHTIRDVRAFIDASRPGGQRNYQLQMMGFPPKQLTDLDQTVEQAGIANSVVIQKF